MLAKNNDKVRILLCGYYFQGNTGDDLLMESIVEMLSRYGEVKVTSTEAFDIDLINWCQLLVIGAGSLITPRGIGGYEHAKYAKENGKKVIYYSQTIEEGHPQFKEHLARADLITVRDSESKWVVESNGFRAVLASDPIFKIGKRTIGFSFRKWVNEPLGIEEKLASMLDNIAVDYEILSIPYTENKTDTESDSLFHKRIIHYMKTKPKQATYSDALGHIDLLIGMRLHALLNAVNIGKKVLAIDYDTKIRRIFYDLSMDNVVVTYDEVDKIPLIVRENIFKSDRLALRGKVNEALVERICSDIKGEPVHKVSVVMPTYNRADYLKEAVDSILAQTMQDWELIIIDDGSLDNTKELVESYRENKIRYYNFGHNGITFSRNIGSLLSRGEIIVVADSDDVNLPNRLEVTCKEMEKDKADILYSSMFHFWDSGEKELIPSLPFSYSKLKEGNFIYHPTVAYRRDVAMICPYNENLEMVEDYHMYIQAAEKGYKFHCVEEPLVMHRLHKGQISSARSEEMAEIHRRLVDSEGIKLKIESEEDHYPMVSIIIPTYNRPDMLRDALISVLSQTYQNFEIIVVNDAGKDVSKMIDALNSKENIVYLQHKENKGLPAARNTGLKAAKGKYIAYLDDDDIYYPNHLETLARFLENTHFKAAYTDSYHASQEWITDRYIVVGKEVHYSEDFDRDKLLISNYIPVINVLHRKDLLEEVGLFDETLNAHEDWDLWIRISRQCDFHHIKKVTAEVRTRSDGSTMTSHDRMPFLKTLRTIHSRYSHLVTESHIFEKQKKAEKTLTIEVEIKQLSSSVMQYEHLHRYRFAREFIRGRKVLNLACGEGYGSSILAEDAGEVIGVDIDDTKIRHACSNYIKENLSFIKGSIIDVPIEGEKIFDVIVCFEALENLREHDELMREVKRLLKNDGIFIVSTPNKHIYSDRPSFRNSFHLNELYFDEFKTLLNKNFKYTLIYGQKIYPSSNIFPFFKQSRNTRNYVVEKSEKRFLFVQPEKKHALYFIAISSNADFDYNDAIGNSYLVDVSETVFRAKEAYIGNLESVIKEKDTYVGHLEGTLRAKEAYIGNLESAIKEKDTYVGHLEGTLMAKEAYIGNLESALKEKDQLISQQHWEMARLKAIEESLTWRIAQKFLKALEYVFPYHTRRGQFFFKILFKVINRLKVYSCSAASDSKEKVKGFVSQENAAEPEKSLKTDETRNLNFNVFENPQVSIIIPVWNKWPYTYNCLKSILENTDKIFYEIILVDDGSSDETHQMLEKATGIHVIKNESNLGFVLACNKGAKNANGKYLLFLNNDTEVTKGWLRKMVDLIEGNKTIGAVGAKLIFPDGMLQEAGSIVWSDGSTLGYGRGENSDNPEFSYLRDVDYCSGACLLVEKELFLNVGGFDEIYIPAYYEDADLCLKIKALGRRIVYHPDAKIIHNEFGTTTREMAMQLCLTKRADFQKKWDNVLSTHLPPHRDHILRARDSRKGKRILAIDDIIPASHLGSGFPRTNILLKYLAELNYVVTFYPLSDPFAYQPYTKELQLMGIEVFCGEPLEINKFLKERSGFYDMILISRPHNAAKLIKPLREHFPNAFIIYDAEAIYSMREITRMRLNGIGLSKYKERKMILKELEPIKYADAVIIVSEYERKQIEEFGYKNIFVWGYALNIKTPEKKFSDRKDLLFVGGFLQSPTPNEDAVLYFTNNIFPKIKDALGCRLFVVGTNHLESISNLKCDSITVTGYVENLRDYYERCRIFVVPTRFGAGIPLKLLEAMSYGVPSVITPLVATQIGLSEGEGILIGWNDKDFAEKIIQIYKDEVLWYELQKKALDYIRDQFNPDELKLSFDKFLKKEIP